MKFCRILSILMALCLFVSPAAAAPTRDPQLEEMTVDLGMQTLAELIMGAAVLSDVTGMEENANPSPALLEGVLALGLYNGALPRGENAQNGKVSVDPQTAADYYNMIFSSGAYTPIQSPSFPGLCMKGQDLQFDLSSLSGNPQIGVYIYSTAFDGEKVTVLCDLYTYYDSRIQSAQVLPEDGMSWLCHGEIALTYSPEAAFGYTLDRFILSPVYLNGMLSDWHTAENTVYEYSVKLPSIFGLAADDPAAMTWQTADGAAEIQIRVHTGYKKSFDETLDAFLLSNPGQTVTQQREFSQFFAVGEGAYTLWIVPEGLEWAYAVTLSFPAERQAEFTLYAEFIRNSMIVWGLSNG